MRSRALYWDVRCRDISEDEISRTSRSICLTALFADAIDS